MKSIIFVFLFFYATTFYAQKIMNVDEMNNLPGQNLMIMRNGQIAEPYKYVKITEGSPFFKTDFLTATIIFPQGKNLQNQKVKINILENSLHYLENGIEMIATVPIAKVLLNDSVLQQQFLFWHHSNFKDSIGKVAKGWYQQLCEGKLNLFILTKKQISEFTPYGSSIAEQKIKNTFHYYILKDNQLIEIKKWNDLLENIGNSEKLNTFVSEQKLKGKKESDYITLINWVNKQ